MLTSSVARWSSLVARWAHNPKVAGSNPALATTEYDGNTRLRAVANANREVGVLRCGPSMAHDLRDIPSDDRWVIGPGSHDRADATTPNVYACVTPIGRTRCQLLL